ncbi:N-methyl-D-aspartate receptor glutamate-binding subunit [Phaffia rhodozyma]|uniref:N-methyl-D-aspartate receptor glutamate-binding subunit n=1 Tax=Phaffia rhodozyma TaxID=264483 RepID=A0A0F7SKM8_PHARH|nr:N-methyl-D-aspartate receptor glutamate-binding subunit [Phaffia rhodozyma]
MSYAPPAYNPPSGGPKSYDAINPAPPTADANAPLLASSSAAAQNAFIHSNVPRQGLDDDDEDDFKFGTSVSSSDVSIRMGFIRKVYSILAVQLLFTAIVAVGMSQPAAIRWTQENTWFFWLPLVGTFASLFTLFWKIDSHPLNLFLLGAFTLFESLSIGTVVSYYDQKVVIQALVITLGVFVGLSLFTLQSKWDFDGLAPWLFGGIMVMFTTSLVSVFFPFSRGMDLFLACVGCLVFSGYILFDTHAIMNKLSPDEYIMGALRLYLDIINLFLQVLRVLNNQNRD